LICNFDKIYSHIFEKQPDIFCMSETWCNETKNVVNIDSYQFIHKDRDKDKRGGGVGAYVHKNYDFKIHSDFAPCNSMEFVTFEIIRDTRSFIVTVLYRPPNSSITDFFSQIQTLLDSLKSKFTRRTCFIIGDFNIDQNGSKESGKLLEIFQQFDFLQHITEKTRVTSCTATTIDLIFANTPTDSIETYVTDSDISDHRIVSAEIRIKVARKSQPVFKFRPINTINVATFHESIKLQLLNSDLSGPLSALNLQTLLLDSLNKCCPLKEVKFSKPFAPWMKNISIINSQKERDKLQKKYKKNPTDDTLYISYRKSLKAVSKLIEEERSSYITNIAKEKDSATFWKIFNKLQHKEKPNCQIQAHDYNTFYANTAHRLTNKEAVQTSQLKIICDQSPTFGFYFQNVTCADVMHVVKSLKSNKQGSCGINSSVIKLLPVCFYEKLTDSINHTITSCIFPAELKRACITPIPKTKNSKHLSDYRPISVQRTLSKVFEKCMLYQLESFFTQEGLFDNTQYGFRPKKSTSTLLQRLNNLIQLNLNSGKLSIIIFLDFSKAFDLMAHEILLKKLIALKFSKSALQLITSYLRDRTVRTCINGNESDELQLNMGVPQGSILGPMLFNVYVHDLKHAVDTSIRVLQYADDCQLLISFEKTSTFNNITASITTVIQQIKTWSEQNNLVLNESKTQILPIFNKNTTFSRMPFFSDNILSFRREAKNLGIIYNYKFNWNSHFTVLLQSMRRSTYLIKQFFKRYTLPSDYNTRKRIALSVLFPLMRYSSELFFNHTHHCQIKWKIMSKLLANAILMKYCSSDDSRRLNIPSLQNTIDASIFCAMTQNQSDANSLTNISLHVPCKQTRSCEQANAIIPHYSIYKSTLHEYSAYLFQRLSKEMKSLVLSQPSRSIAKSVAKKYFID